MNYDDETTRRIDLVVNTLDEFSRNPLYGHKERLAYGIAKTQVVHAFYGPPHPAREEDTLQRDNQEPDA